MNVLRITQAPSSFSGTAINASKLLTERVGERANLYRLQSKLSPAHASRSSLPSHSSLSAHSPLTANAHSAGSLSLAEPYSTQELSKNHSKLISLVDKLSLIEGPSISVGMHGTISMHKSSLQEQVEDVQSDKALQLGDGLYVSVGSSAWDISRSFAETAQSRAKSKLTHGAPLDDSVKGALKPVVLEVKVEGFKALKGLIVPEKCFWDRVVVAEGEGGVDHSAGALNEGNQGNEATDAGTVVGTDKGTTVNGDWRTTPIKREMISDFDYLVAPIDMRGILLLDDIQIKFNPTAFDKIRVVE